MPKINMTIDLDIEEGLYIKIDAAGRVSIRAEDQQGCDAATTQEIVVPAKTISGSWYAAKQEILEERKTRRPYRRKEETRQAIEAITHMLEPFTHQTLLELGIRNPWALTKKLTEQGLIRICSVARGDRTGKRGGTTPLLFEVVHNA